jgi:hypothetical protein
MPVYVAENEKFQDGHCDRGALGCDAGNGPATVHRTAQHRRTYRTEKGQDRFGSAGRHAPAKRRAVPTPSSANRPLSRPGGDKGRGAYSRQILSLPRGSASPSPILTNTESKQRRYEELLHARYDMYMRDFDAALKRGDEAVAHGADPWLAYENAREAKREAWQAINRMWLESQKP